MASLRQIIAQGRKRLGLLVGAGAPAGIFAPGSTEPLIPAVAGLTEKVLKVLEPTHGSTLKLVQDDLTTPNIETILTHVRGLSGVIGSTKVHGLDGNGFKALSELICNEIGKIVGAELPDGVSAYSELTSWISGTDREHSVEIFTTNYDLLFEQALERGRTPYFDGFAGAKKPFFDPASVANSDQLPSRWARVWKLHGSLGWETNKNGDVVRTGSSEAAHLVYPEHLKYAQTQKAPYAALFDRLRRFLMTEDTLLIATGFSFADAHVSALLDECLSANPSSTVFAFQFKPLAEERHACEVAGRRANMAVYSPDMAMINGISAKWLPGDPPTRDWSAIRATYWNSDPGTGTTQFSLGRFDHLCKFFASSRSNQVLPALAPISPAGSAVSAVTA
jgi:hypothetical protein